MVLVLCTGRCGSMTFYKACKHITNYSVGFESSLGRVRLQYPDRHIEVDNRLVWRLGELGKDDFYVHLVRDKDAVARSFNKRWDIAGGIIRAFAEGILRTSRKDLDVCRRYVDIVMANIEQFLEGKRYIEIDIDSPRDQFRKFWVEIGAEGSLVKALSEFDKRYNASK